MSLYKVGSDKLEAVMATSFSAERVLERRDLQRLLKANISAVSTDLMVLAEEFGDWEESNRRIDLLCLDKLANLVVVEIKRTEDGGHMELQAVRYAAMVSSMTLDRAIKAHADHLGGDDALERAREHVLSFIDAESMDVVQLTGEVRIILVSANFSQEITTSVLWLNKSGLDITCIRLAPYKLNDTILIDATQIIPLPETVEYEVKIREKAKEERTARTARELIFKRFWGQLIERSRDRTPLLNNRSAPQGHWVSAGIGRAGFGLNLVLTEDVARAECFIRFSGADESVNLAAFNSLKAQRERIEAEFGEELDWQDLPNRLGCRICRAIPGGWRSPESDWPALQDELIEKLIKLERALKEPIQRLAVGG